MQKQVPPQGKRRPGAPALPRRQAAGNGGGHAKRPQASAPPFEPAEGPADGAQASAPVLEVLAPLAVGEAPQLGAPQASPTESDSPPQAQEGDSPQASASQDAAPQASAPEEFLTVPEFAELYKVPGTKLHEWISRQKGPKVDKSIHRKPRIPRSEYGVWQPPASWLKDHPESEIHSSSVPLLPSGATLESGAPGEAPGEDAPQQLENPPQAVSISWSSLIAEVSTCAQYALVGLEESHGTCRLFALKGNMLHELTEGAGLRPGDFNGFVKGMLAMRRVAGLS